MFELPVDALYVWLGVATAGIVMLGVVMAFPTTVPPDAAAVADTVDGVAVGPTGAHATTSPDATEIRLGPHRLALRNDGGSASASFVYGPITPVLADDQLELVLYGQSPDTVFESRAAFRTAVERAQSRGQWRPAPSQLEIRRVNWGDTDVTLVG